MRLRFALLSALALLLVAQVAGAATQTEAPAAGPASPAVLAAPALSPAPAACGLSLPITSPSTPELTPARMFLSTTTCGSCSRSPCVGATYNQFCGFHGGQPGTCVSPYGNDCSTGQPQCQCWFGPLP
jgi:hypothetical protein